MNEDQRWQEAEERLNAFASGLHPRIVSLPVYYESAVESECDRMAQMPTAELLAKVKIMEQKAEALDCDLLEYHQEYPTTDEELAAQVILLDDLIGVAKEILLRRPFPC